MSTLRPLDAPGGIDFVAIFEGMRAIGYDGCVTMHQAFGGDMTPEEATRRTAAFLRGVIILRWDCRDRLHRFLHYPHKAGWLTASGIVVLLYSQVFQLHIFTHLTVSPHTRNVSESRETSGMFLFLSVVTASQTL